MEHVKHALINNFQLLILRAVNCQNVKKMSSLKTMDPVKNAQSSLYLAKIRKHVYNLNVEQEKGLMS